MAKAATPKATPKATPVRRAAARKLATPASTPASSAPRGVQHAVLSIGALDGHARNYRKHPDAQLARLASSLARFSQVRSIVVKARPNGRYTILAGHGVTEAARREGISEMRCDVVPDDWDEARCAAYIAADNMGGAEDDLTALAALLEEQQSAGYDLESMGWSGSELDALLDGPLGRDADQPPDFGAASEDEQGRLDHKREVECPHCGHRFEPD